MKLKSYLKADYLTFNTVFYIVCALVTGAIPAVAIVLRADLIDYAAAKVTVATAVRFLHCL